MKNFALLDKNNIVVNVSIADESWDSTGWVEYIDENSARIGDLYINGYFQPPKPEGDGWIWNEKDREWVNEQADTQTL
jgi:hypothetical protein